MNSLNIENIRELCKAQKFRWTNHIMIRLTQRDIKTDDVEYAIMNGEIIEPYPSDYPHPSCLILGVTSAERHLHIVCGLSSDELYLITAYEPNLDEWENDYITRKRKER